ncbi:MAG: hypothetical protein M1282_05145 [Chloroflexi bacterium]|nr:hypothetical protein [Chloroflexota bacterium]
MDTAIESVSAIEIHDLRDKGVTQAAASINKSLFLSAHCSSPAEDSTMNKEPGRVKCQTQKM